MNSVRPNLELFDTYGLEYKYNNNKLYIRPRWRTSSGRNYIQWTNISTTRGIKILNRATDNDIESLYIQLAENVREEINYRLFISGDNTGELLYRRIHPLTANNKQLIINVKIGDEYSRLNMARIITENTSIREFYRIVYALNNIMTAEYSQDSEIIIQFVELPEENPELINVRDGKYNCVILPVILLLQKRKKSQANDRRIKQLVKYHDEIKETGLNNEGILKVSKIARINIAIYDQSGNIWYEFGNDKKLKTLLLDVHNNHATVRNDMNLLEQVNEIKKKKKFL